MYCYINGKIIPEEEAKVGIFDIGLLRGYGIYEAMSAIDGRLFMLSDHLARFRKSAELLEIHVPVDDTEIERIIRELVEKNGFNQAGRRANIKFILTGGNAIKGIDFDRNQATFYIFFEEWKRIDEKYYIDGSKVMLYEHLREYPEYKTINYITAVPLQKKMRDVGALEALYTWHNQILECATSNFFVVEGNKLFTPKDNILLGITRKAVIELARANGLIVEECNVSLQEVYSADECFLTSSFKDVVPVVQVGERTIADGKVGEMSKKMMQLFEEGIKA